MNREIKFRAWDFKKKLMVKQDSTDRLDKCLTYYELNPKVALMQYTGLKDKNGVEIYEGDIVSISGVALIGTIEERRKRRKEILGIEKVHFDTEDCITRIGKARIDEFTGWNNLLVIGNIYENPELLEDNQ